MQGAVSGLHMVACFHAAGLPRGLLNVATGKGAEIGDFLTMHPDVNCITFTGGDTGGQLGSPFSGTGIEGTQNMCLYWAWAHAWDGNFLTMHPCVN